MTKGTISGKQLLLVPIMRLHMRSFLSGDEQEQAGTSKHTPHKYAGDDTAAAKFQTSSWTISKTASRKQSSLEVLI